MRTLVFATEDASCVVYAIEASPSDYVPQGAVLQLPPPEPV